MRVKLYTLLNDAIETGISLGISRALKHEPEKTAKVVEAIRDKLEHELRIAIEIEISEYITFDEEEL